MSSDGEAGHGAGFPTPQLLDSSTAEFTEQSENVYENKGRGKQVLVSWRSADL